MFKDKILTKLSKKYPPPTWKQRSQFLFEDLVETVISQQLSTKAADSIFAKFKKIFSSKKFPTPTQVLKADINTLKTAGISQSKANYIHNVAKAFVDKEMEVEKILKLRDEEIITALTKIKGIGRWSAEMILIFTLNRPDVFSFGDLGLKKAIQNLYGITEKEKILTLTQKWSPNRSLACWYLWRSLENK